MNINTIIAVVVLCAAVLIVALAGAAKRRKRHREDSYQALKKRREDSLKEALSNPAEVFNQMTMESYRPYRVEYSSEEKGNLEERVPMLQINEKDKLSEKKYIFRSNEVIMLGLQFGMVSVLGTYESGNTLCQVFFSQGVYNVRSFGIEEICLKRNNRTAIVDQQGIQLKSNDVIIIRQTEFHIYYLKQ